MQHSNVGLKSYCSDQSQDPNNEIAKKPTPNHFVLCLQEFHELVMKNADIIQATGDAVCVFPEVQCLTPRYVLFNGFLPSFTSRGPFCHNLWNSTVFPNHSHVEVFSGVQLFIFQENKCFRNHNILSGFLKKVKSNIIGFTISDICTISKKKNIALFNLSCVKILV